MPTYEQGMKELVVVSGKGGTGKTSLVASFAVLAENKVLADCDVDAADLHLVLSPTPQQSHVFRSGNEAVITVGPFTSMNMHLLSRSAPSRTTRQAAMAEASIQQKRPHRRTASLPATMPWAAVMIATSPVISFPVVITCSAAALAARPRATTRQRHQRISSPAC